MTPVVNRTGISRVCRHLQEIFRQATRNLCAKATIQDLLRCGFFNVFWCPDISVFETSGTIAKTEGTEHAVTIKPMTVRSFPNSLTTRAVSEKRTFQVSRNLSIQVIQNIVMLTIEILQATMAAWYLIRTFNLCAHILIYPYFLLLTSYFLIPDA